MKKQKKKKKTLINPTVGKFAITDPITYYSLKTVANVFFSTHNVQQITILFHLDEMKDR